MLKSGRCGSRSKNWRYDIDMTDLGIGEDEETKTKTKEKHLKRIKRISKGLGKAKVVDLTEDQKREIQRLEARDGKVVVGKNQIQRQR